MSAAVRYYLDISTAHVRPEDLRFLGGLPCTEGLTVNDRDPGYEITFDIKAADEESSRVRNEAGPVINQLIGYAHARKCDRIIIDPDAWVQKDLPVFEHL